MGDAIGSTLGLAVQAVQFGRLLIRGPGPIKD